MPDLDNRTQLVPSLLGTSVQIFVLCVHFQILLARGYRRTFFAGFLRSTCRIERSKERNLI